MKIRKSGFIVFLILLSLLCCPKFAWLEEKTKEKEKEKQVFPVPPKDKIPEASSATLVDKEQEPIKSSLILSGPVIASPLEVYIEAPVEAPAETKE